ncbi:hypothetical protein [Streptomyces sp. NPDC048659]|uniref:hypothetical protein n=1 Tax=Streptomyces sp. NPDC048659 TaxID=3155489 RepID=UPI003423EFF2
MRPRTPAVTLALIAALAALGPLTGCARSGDADPAAGPAAGPEAAAAATAPPVTAFPAPRGAPAPAPSLAAAPRAGDVRVEDGPFTDRVRFDRLTLTDRRTVTGRLTVTSDVSDVVALELRAAFYDTRGRLAGTGTFTYSEEHGAERGGSHGERRAEGAGIDFSVSLPASAPAPAAAVLSVPVLVNE